MFNFFCNCVCFYGVYICYDMYICNFLLYLYRCVDSFFFVLCIYFCLKLKGWEKWLIWCIICCCFLGFFKIVLVLCINEVFCLEVCILDGIVGVKFDLEGVGIGSNGVWKFLFIELFVWFVVFCFFSYFYIVVFIFLLWYKRW